MRQSRAPEPAHRHAVRAYQPFRIDAPLHTPRPAVAVPVRRLLERYLMSCDKRSSGEGGFHMAIWRFYQGLKNEWRWYQLEERGLVLTASDRGFAELDACMANAERAGFTRSGSFQVHARAPTNDAPRQ